MKRCIIFLLLTFFIFVGAPISFADPVNEAQPDLTTTSTTKDYSDDDCDPQNLRDIPLLDENGDKQYDSNGKLKTVKQDCYQLLESIPLSEGRIIDSIDTTKSGNDKGIGGFINFMFEMGIGIAGVLGVIMLVIYGFQYAANDKNINTFGKLKEKIGNVILGLLLLLSIFIILNTINPDLLVVEPEITEQLLSIEENAVKNQYGFSVLSGGGGNYDTTGKNDVARINKNISQFDTYFKKYATQYGVSCTYLKGLMYRESGGNPNAQSSAGATGLMQFMPGTARDMGFSSSEMLNPEKAIHASAKYVKMLTKGACNGKPRNSVCDASNLLYVSAAYNAGPGSNKATKCGNKPNWQCYKETSHYAPTVVNNTTELNGRGWGCD